MVGDIILSDGETYVLDWSSFFNSSILPLSVALVGDNVFGSRSANGRVLIVVLAIGGL